MNETNPAKRIVELARKLPNTSANTSYEVLLAGGHRVYGRFSLLGDDEREYVCVTRDGESPHLVSVAHIVGISNAAEGTAR